MHSPASTDIGRNETKPLDFVELFDLTTPGKSPGSPLVNGHQLESPSVVCCPTFSDELKNMVALFSKTLGYEPNLAALNYTSETQLLSMLQRGISDYNMEGRVNLVVVFVVVLDTLLLMFEFYDKDESQPLWMIFLNWVFLFVYTLEIAFRLYIATPTSAFFRKRFYVLDLMIVVVCVALQIASSIPAYASSIRAIRFVRMLRFVKLSKFLRVFVRVFEIWHEHNKQKVQVDEGTSLYINLAMDVDNYKLQELLEVQGSVENYYEELSEDRWYVDVQELYTIIKLLKEDEEKNRFNCSEFFVEWLILLILWLVIVMGLSWLFCELEFENYEMVIEENLALKSLVDNSLPVRDLLPDVLTSLAGCSGNTTNHHYISLNKVYQEYTSKNKTLWDDVNRFVGPYTFTNPWTFAGSSFFTISIATTIGWGSFTPSTTIGQMLVVFGCLPTIYITIVFGRKNIEMFKSSLCKTQYESIGMIVLFSVFILGAFMLISGLVFSKYEDWTLWESVYFCWISFSTIGFGDYSPTFSERLNLIYTLLVIVGWQVVSFVISVMEVTLSAMHGMDWWSERYLCLRVSNKLPNTSLVKEAQQEKCIGVAKLVKHELS